MDIKKLHPIWFFIAALFIFRLFTLSVYPLIDTTEARYGEIARIMVETNNWVTPQFDYEVPFWGKPPLHTWASASFASVMGVSEFTLRLPHLLVGLITLFLVGAFAKRFNLSVVVSCLVLTTSLGFFAAVGMIMTDALLLLSMTMAMLGFALAWNEGRAYWSYIGFAGLGIGLLAKGPIILILMGLAIFPWLIVNFGLIEGIKQLFKRVRVFSGLLLMLTIALPWYLLAEHATPGFLNYFLVGEHFLRFVQSGWEGDLYGTAHSEPRGIIWIYWLLVAFPWSFYFLGSLFFKTNRIELSIGNLSFPLKSYLIFWLISPMILFTFSGNILPIYVLPGLPALALLVSIFSNGITRMMLVTSLITPLVISGFLYWELPKIANYKSDKALLSEINSNVDVYYLGIRTFSGRFYTQGKAIELSDIEALSTRNFPVYVVVPNDQVDAVKNLYNCKTKRQNKRRQLLLCET